MGGEGHGVFLNGAGLLGFVAADAPGAGLVLGGADFLDGALDDGGDDREFGVVGFIVASKPLGDAGLGDGLLSALDEGAIERLPECGLRPVVRRLLPEIEVKRFSAWVVGHNCDADGLIN